MSVEHSASAGRCQLWQRLQQGIQQAPVSETYKEEQRLTLLGAVRYRFSGASIEPRLEMRSSNAWVLVPGARFFPFRPLSSPHWIEFWLRKCMRVTDDCTQTVCKEPPELLARQFFTRLAPGPLMRQLRRRLIDRFPLPVSWRNQAPRLWPCSLITTQHLKWLRHNAALVDQCQSESPGLLPAIGLMVHLGSATNLSSTRCVKAWWRRQGLTDSGWRVVHDGGLYKVRPMAPIRFVQSDLLGVIAVLNAMAQPGAPSRWHAAILRPIGWEGWNEATLPAKATLANLLRSAHRAWRSEPYHKRLLQDQLSDVLDRLVRGFPLKPPRRARWTWWLRQCAGDALPPGYEPFADCVLPAPAVQGLNGQYDFCPLLRPRELVEEGRAMRHCMGDANYLQDLLDQRIYVWSIRCPATQRRLATACLDVELGQVEVAARFNRHFADEQRIIDLLLASRSNPTHYDHRRRSCLTPPFECDAGNDNNKFEASSMLGNKRGDTP